MDDYFGRIAYRLSPGEYPVADGITWDGRQYRARQGPDAKVLELAGPEHVRPWALSQYVIATGGGISVHQPWSDRTLTHVPGTRRAMQLGLDQLVS